MGNETFLFIYYKYPNIRVFNSEQSKLKHKQLLLDGYIHTSTIDACRFLEHLHNDKVCNEINELSDPI